MDKIMQRQNIYYKDLIQGKILSPLGSKNKKGGLIFYEIYWKTWWSKQGPPSFKRQKNCEST